jgi:two-component system NtrC family sensor kinase
MVGFHSDEEARNFEITTNPTCLSQIVFNLIINAAQAIKEQNDNVRNKSIIIQIETFENYIKLAIIDDGPGVKNEYLESIFQAFFTTKGSGTGLGLSICQNLARQLGTKIEFQNNSPLLGATFSINLPIN